MNRSLLSEIQKCEACRIYAPEHHDQHCRHLGLPAGSDLDIWMLPNGMTLGFGSGMTVPLHSDFILCEAHTTLAEAGEEAAS